MTEVPDQLKRALVYRYELQREIGRGRIETVYLAQDLKHRRQVTTKVLRPELSASLFAKRLRCRIEITANLNPPHILPMHDSGEAARFLFYVMPCVEGKSLRDRLQRDKQLPVEDALNIDSQVADALCSAHRHNVIHRDIKPANILLEDGHAFVADFGVARPIDIAGDARLFATRIAIGTPAYLRPDRPAADRESDATSDAHSLGCVLQHEIRAGESPLTRPAAESIVHPHLTANPRVTVVRPHVANDVHVKSCS